MRIWLGLLPVCAFLLTGCVQKWSKPGAGPEEFDAMKASCTAQAYSQFPQMFQQIQASNGYYTPVTTNCYSTGTGGASCYSQGGQYVPPTIITVDANNIPRNQAIKGCFYSNGWSPASGDSGPTSNPAPSSAPDTKCIPNFDCD
jgi:hypothetical protein